MNHVLQSLTFFSLVAFFFLLPGTAMAEQLECINGVPVGNLYDYSATCQGITGLQNIFSGMACDFQKLLNEIMKRVYCGVQTTLTPVIKIAITLYILVFGVQLTIGAAQASFEEIFMRLFKLACVWVFATEASYAIGLMYSFFTGAIDEGIGWVLGVIMPASPDYIREHIALRQMDVMLYSAVTGPFTQNGAKVAGFMAVIAYIMPPIFFIFTYLSIKSIAIFVRALLVYLLALSAIAFLIALSPIFLSFALFRTTFRFFDDWLRFMISFTLQVILVFASVGMWLVVLSQMGNFFAQLANMIAPTTDQGIVAAGAIGAVETFAICQHSIMQGTFGPTFLCDWNKPLIYPSDFQSQGPFIYYLIINLVSLATITYVFDGLMKNVPALARQLAGPSYAPQIAGGTYRGSIRYPGILKMQNTGKTTSSVLDQLRSTFGMRR